MKTSQIWGLTYHEEEVGDERKPLAVSVPMLLGADCNGGGTIDIELVV